MIHLKRLEKTGHSNGRAVIHACLYGEYTLCRWHFMSEEMFAGHRVSLAAETKEPIDCGKCLAKIRMAITDELPGLKSEEIEAIYDGIQASARDQSASGNTSVRVRSRQIRTA